MFINGLINLQNDKKKWLESVSVKWQKTYVATVMISNHNYKWICIFCVAQQANKILVFKRIIQTTMAFHGDVGFGINLNETTVIGMYIMRYRVMA